jgi:hypothetical protein
MLVCAHVVLCKVMGAHAHAYAQGSNKMTMFELVRPVSVTEREKEKVERGEVAGSEGMYL